MPDQTCSPAIKRLRKAVIDAIDSCPETDDEAVWRELLGFAPEWRENLRRCLAEKAASHAQRQSMQRADVFACLCSEQISDAEATQALAQIEAREAV